MIVLIKIAPLLFNKKIYKSNKIKQYKFYFRLHKNNFVKCLNDSENK